MSENVPKKRSRRLRILRETLILLAGDAALLVLPYAIRNRGLAGYLQSDESISFIVSLFIVPFLAAGLVNLPRKGTPEANRVVRICLWVAGISAILIAAVTFAFLG